MREMKPSSIDWIGDIPVSWKVMPNKYLMRKEKKICPVYHGEDILSLTMKGVIVRDLDDTTLCWLNQAGRSVEPGVQPIRAS